MNAVKCLAIAVAMGVLLLIQFPFRIVNAALERPLDWLHFQAERMLEKRT